MNRPGRNDPCTCGSGTKYKRCCLGKEEARAAYVAQLRGRALPLLARLARFTETQVRAPLQSIAREEFSFWQPPLSRAQAARVIDFLMFDYGPSLHLRRNADEFIAAHGDSLDAEERTLVEAWGARAMRPYVVSNWSDGVLALRDLLDDERPPIDVYALQTETPLPPGEAVALRALPFAGAYFALGEPLRFEGQRPADVAASVRARHADHVRAKRIVPMEEFLRLSPVLDELAAQRGRSGLIVLPGSA